MSDNTSAKGFYNLKCFKADGSLRWETGMEENLVVNNGLQNMSQMYFQGAAYTAAWYLGLYGAGASNNPVAGDTMASHAGWTEFDGYSQATRPAAVFATPTTANPSVTTNAANPSLFTINVTGPVTIGGAFLCSENTKNGTTGTLFSAADFLTPGDRVVYNTDVLQMFYEHRLTAS
jgi:hypothetical protein